MTEAEILRKAIEKAMANGYATALVWDEETGTLCEAGGLPGKYQPVCSNSIIFDHEFAKAFWGEERFDGLVKDGDTLVRLVRLEIEYWWQFHLQQMVLEENPVKYLGRYL